MLLRILNRQSDEAMRLSAAAVTAAAAGASGAAVSSLNSATARDGRPSGSGNGSAVHCRIVGSLPVKRQQRACCILGVRVPRLGNQD